MVDSIEVDFLVVDDSRDAADTLSALLQTFGHTTQVAYSAQEALAKAGAFKPMCVMLDIGMPGMDGLQLAREFRQKFGDDVVLVAVTGYSEENPRVAETFKIVDHYFTKPLSVEALRRMLPGR
ncbi:MAG: response regulator [Burkholderiaceae bacterium]